MEATRSKSGPNVLSRSSQSAMASTSIPLPRDENPYQRLWDYQHPERISWPIPSRATPKPSKRMAPPAIQLIEVKSEMPAQKVGKAQGIAESHQTSHGATHISPKEQRKKGGKRSPEDRNEATKLTEKGGLGSDLRKGRPGSRQTVAAHTPPAVPLQLSGGRGRSQVPKERKKGTQISTGRKSLEKKPKETDKKRCPGKDKK